jgi:hypothetical protein
LRARRQAEVDDMQTTTSPIVPTRVALIYRDEPRRRLGEPQLEAAGALLCRCSAMKRGQDRPFAHRAVRLLCSDDGGAASRPGRQHAFKEGAR